MDAPESTRTPTPSRWHIPTLLVIALLVHGWIIANTEVAARDSIGFIRYAMQFDQPPPDPADPNRQLTRLEIIRRAEHPPGYPLMVWLMSIPVRAIAGGPTPENMVLATQLVSALAGILLILPMYRLVQRMFDSTAAFRAVAIFQCLPVPAEITSDGLSDGLYLLAVVSALAFAAGSFREQSSAPLLGAGICTGLAYLVRPEGVLLMAAIGGMLIAAVFLRQITWKLWIRRMVLLGIGAASIALPYIALIGKLTNKATGSVLVRTLQGEDARPTWHMDTPTSFRDTITKQPIAAWWTQGFDNSEGRILWAVQVLIGETSKSAHYVPFALGVIGIVVLLPRWRRDPVMLMPLILGGLNAALLIFMGSRIGYISERHTLWLATLMVIFAAGYLPTFAQWLTRWPTSPRSFTAMGYAQTLTILILISGIPGWIKPLHANRKAHHIAGHWLAANTDPHSERIFDPFCWADYYAGRVFQEGWIRLDDSTPLYVIVEPKNLTPHSRLPALDQAKDMIRSGKPVFHWPENVPLEQSRVAIYRVVPVQRPGTASR
ncbi:ArnT family glycosyltransferase [Tuwongella immobilis]|uniref:Glycosyltransferase RgtA/B/C/D-like domain-containing protein n=1 Tax=Tuwongella immobilis TaxID=692036 RepID=A0A6C2YNP0_9BACT|nr:glycosyltransferase family 39 protein [Tuwongella immobilis]VIP03240.1 Uncharacterized protein OS=Singulisphaera acidiphila (strain ATCC BAA-1392 / DSM 18658 / VKM B-2454 / MOB10) GN=Sinac_3095 PE=4 SV=1: PMT_2 [Tuwongella immobilis]VTS03807.1 Uncharacterized protein OS=Singulisphaera acidiphila (strain ATCC BAA-1392 / DSM 18658 / VKM B-2454 / MOB10) GN=Sinac_3095 PE=4 SV=1: PMT_2 [Tuwongella immobilis]